MGLKGYEFKHRGLHKNVPENSLLAFKKALYRNMPIELDVRITKDSKLVVFHDANLKRMTGIDKKIEKCNYNEIKDIKLNNSDEKIPLLIDVLNLINNKVLLLIEIKSNNKKMYKKLAKLLKNYNNFLLQTFSLKTYYWFKLHTKYKIGILTYSNFKKKIVLNPSFISMSKYNAFKYKNIPLFIWTIKNKEELEKAKKIGDSFIVDY